MEPWKTYQQQTRFIHAGQLPDPITGAITVPISLSSTFAQKSPGETYSGYQYSRTNNPTRSTMQKLMASSQNAQFCLAFASGCATTATIMALYGPGDNIISSDDVYGGTRRLFTKMCLPSQGLDFSFVNTSNLEQIKEAVKQNTKMIWIQTPSNPLLKITDIQAVSEFARQRGILTAIDNTFSSPYCQTPLDHGADIVVHSCTKYIGGHTDVVMGLMCTNNREFYERLKFMQNTIGAVPSPFDCFMVIRSMKTLHLRMKQHSENALAVAKFLQEHPKVQKVTYPGLVSHPQYEVAVKQMKGFSGMISVYLNGGMEESRRFLENVKLFKCAESLGAVECLVEHPAIMTHASVPPEVRAQLGISDNFVRFSVGVENIEDIIRDLTQALDKV